MCPYFIEDRWFPYESLDDGDLLYCQSDSDTRPEPLITAEELADAALPWELAYELIPDLRTL